MSVIKVVLKIPLSLGKAVLSYLIIINILYIFNTCYYTYCICTTILCNVLMIMSILVSRSMEIVF